MFGFSSTDFELKSVLFSSRHQELYNSNAAKNFFIAGNILSHGRIPHHRIKPLSSPAARSDKNSGKSNHTTAQARISALDNLVYSFSLGRNILNPHPRANGLP